MDSTNQLLLPEGYGWGSPSVPENHQYAGPSNTIAGSNTVHFPIHESFQGDGGSSKIHSAPENVDHSLPPTEDVAMQNQLEDYDEEESDSNNLSSLKYLRRSKNSNSDLDIHKEELRRLWLVEDKNLKDVMAFMREKYSLPES
jgi:hypothetical protein